MAKAEMNKAIQSDLARLPNIQKLKSEQEESLTNFIAGKDVMAPGAPPGGERDPTITEKLTNENQLIQEGPPDCYQLLTKKTNVNGFEAVGRWTFGLRDKSKPVKNILLLGEREAGKTTLINTMVNYILGVKWEEGVWFQITEEDKNKTQAKSQTDEITVYEVFTETLNLRIIDTPGYGSTDGKEDDKKTAEKLLILLQSRGIIRKIHAVCLVVKSGCQRLTDIQSYIVDAILSLFGKDIEENIVMLIHSDGVSVDDVFSNLNKAKLPCAKDASGEPKHFMFNNIYSMGYTEKTKEVQQMAWDSGYNSIQNFITFLRNSHGKKLRVTEDSLTEHKPLEASVSNLQDTIRSELYLHREPNITEILTNECQLIKKGHPDCYQLLTKKTNVNGHEAVRRWTYGVRENNKPVKNILLVGETGAGKTTLINTMVNYILGVKWEDGVWFQITEEDKNKTQAKSQTDEITVYEVFAGILYLRIIDTPGYGSTDGKEDDKKTAEKLLILFQSEDGVHRIHAVCLVVKSGINRLTNFQCYVIDAILSLFGKDIAENIMVMITHSDGVSVDDVFSALEEAKVICAKDGRGIPLHFMFNNIYPKGYTEKTKKIIHTAFELVYETMESFLNCLQNIKAKMVGMTEGVLKKRKQLEASAYNLQDAIKMDELTQIMLQQTQKALSKNKKKFENNEDFTYEVDIPCKDEVSISVLPKDPIKARWWHLNKGAMCCTICKENCHYPGCWLAKDPSKCSVMKDGRCTVCTKRCPASDHVKQMMIYVPKTKKVKMTFEELRQMYKNPVDVKKVIEEEINDSKVAKDKHLEEAYECILKLEDIALRRDSFSTAVHLDFLIEKMKEIRDEEKAQKLENLNKQFQNSPTLQTLVASAGADKVVAT